MTPADDARECELYARYWDGTLTPSQQAALEATLRADGGARERFRLFNLTAVAAADLGISAAPPALPSRRAWLVRAGAGLAAGVGAFAGYRAVMGQDLVRVAAVKGRVRTAGGFVEPGSYLAAGTAITTAGVGAAALLVFSDGSQVSLAGDSAATVAGPRRLELFSGTAAADVLPTADEPLTLSTPATTITSRYGVMLSLNTNDQGTEVGVQDGSAAVCSPAGMRLDDVRAGELLTVGAGGERRKTALPMPPDAYAWNLSQPLPKGWAVGERDDSGPAPVLRPEMWFDPYHQAVMSQIRSDGNWTRGHATVYPESVLRFRYAVDRPGPGQVVIVVRGPRSSKPASGCLELNTTFRPAADGGWTDLAVPARDLFANPSAPGFDAPWVAFLAIVNTYSEDIGLRVAALEIRRPGRV